MPDGVAALSISCALQTLRQTGVEMEHSLRQRRGTDDYDMCKAVDRARHREIFVLEKLGGKKRHFKADQAEHQRVVFCPLQ